MAAYRRGKEVKLKPAVDEALDRMPRRSRRHRVSAHRFRYAHEELAAISGGMISTRHATEDCPAVQLDSEHPLFVLYTSGTTGKPKGILHTTGGYLTHVTATMKWVFDLRDEDTYWCSADIGWVTGHSYIVYGPLSAGATTRDVRRRARLSAVRPLVAHHRKISRQYFLHFAHRDPRADPPGRSMARRARSFEPAPARLGGRADQSRGLGMVSPRDRQRPLPHRRYLVADRNRRHHDRAHARRGSAETRLGHAAACPAIIPDIVDLNGYRSRHRSRRLPDHAPPVAGHDSHHLGRSGAFQRTILEPAFPARISPATPRAAMPTATTGFSAASTT